MWSHILTLTLLSVAKTSHVSKNNTNPHSDVIVTYSNHAEAIDPPKVIPQPLITTDTTENVKILIPESFATETTVFFEDDTESVIFVPNDKPVYRNNEYRDDTVRLGDVLMRKTVGDVIGDEKIRLETESPSQDFFFISGKNNENVEKPRKETAYIPNQGTRRSERERPRKIALNCSNLDCNNTLKSVCGAKMENRHWRYRIFLNECYFRKVNCGFRYENNRYKVMPAEFCKPIGSHHSERPFVYNPPMPLLPREKPTPVTNVRRSFSSRRSLNVEADGSFCTHPCPASCSEAYEPQCAVTSRGHRKVFVNHCKLDYDSCSYGTVWHVRPLSECVGSEKAEFRQNRAFIGWMQRIGIVDGKGKLVFE